MKSSIENCKCGLKFHTKISLWRCITWTVVDLFSYRFIFSVWPNKRIGQVQDFTGHRWRAHIKKQFPAKGMVILFASAFSILGKTPYTPRESPTLAPTYHSNINTYFIHIYFFAFPRQIRLSLFLLYTVKRYCKFYSKS